MINLGDETDPQKTSAHEQFQKETNAIHLVIFAFYSKCVNGLTCILKIFPCYRINSSIIKYFSGNCYFRGNMY